MPASAQVQAATLDKYLRGWEKFIPEEMVSMWSDDCEQRMLPTTLGVPARSRAEIQSILPEIANILRNHTVTC